MVDRFATKLILRSQYVPPILLPSNRKLLWMIQAEV